MFFSQIIHPKNQFMNVALVGLPVAFRTVPYSTYGAGLTIVRELEPLFTFTLLDPVDHATTGPEDLFAEGVTLNTELRLPTYFFGRPGHHLFGGTWSSREVAELGRLFVPPGVTPQRSDSWSLYCNFDQYLVVDPFDPTHGWGVFGRAGIADQETHPLGWFLSFRIGGNSPISGRESDTFGVGWYYSSTSDELSGILLGDHSQGVELFYNLQVSPCLHITPDFQIIDPARRGVNTALLFGLRVKMDL